MKMYLISDNIDTCTGMRLAGIEGAVVQEKEELKAELNRAMADKDIAVVVLTEKFGQEFPEVIAEARQGRSLPLLIEIPDRHGTTRGENFITSYVNEAIGVKL